MKPVPRRAAPRPASSCAQARPGRYAPAADVPYDKSGSVVARAARSAGLAALLETTTLPVSVSEGVPLMPSV
jgi:hypothetical protein